MSTHVLRIPLRITNLQRNDTGHWTALVNDVPVFRTFGSWQTWATGTEPRRMRDVLPYIAAELQARVRSLERAERKEARADEDEQPRRHA